MERKLQERVKDSCVNVQCKRTKDFHGNRKNTILIAMKFIKGN